MRYKRATHATIQDLSFIHPRAATYSARFVGQSLPRPQPVFGIDSLAALLPWPLQRLLII